MTGRLFRRRGTRAFSLGVALFGGSLWIAARMAAARVTRPIAFGIVWFWIALAPSAAVPLAEVTNDHRPFLAFVGLTIAVVWCGVLLVRRVADSAHAPRVVAGTVASLVLMLHAVGTHARNRVWTSEATLWADVVRTSPGNARGLMNFALTAMRGARYAEARALLDSAARLAPGYPLIYVNMAIAADAQGDTTAAVVELPSCDRDRSAKCRRPSLLRALARRTWSRADAHSHEYARALSARPADVDARRERLLLLAARGIATRTWPRRRAGFLSLDASDSVAPAIAANEPSVTLAPDSTGARRLTDRWYDAGWALTRAGRHAEAIQAYREAVVSRFVERERTEQSRLVARRARLLRSRAADSRASGRRSACDRVGAKQSRVGPRNAGASDRDAGAVTAAPVAARRFESEAATATTAVPRIAVVIPCFRVAAHVGDVVRSIPRRYAPVICVDDASPDDIRGAVEALHDPRVVYLRHARNRGVGGAVMTGWNEALARGADIVVKMDGDGQMRGEQLDALVAPLLDGSVDVAKGNRFVDHVALEAMPRGRLVGNALLSFAVKLVSGYWNVLDPTNGFVAVRAGLLHRLDRSWLAERYYFETSLLVALNVAHARVADVALPARYVDAASSLRIRDIAATFPWLLARSLVPAILLALSDRRFRRRVDRRAARSAARAVRGRLRCVALGAVDSHRGPGDRRHRVRGRPPDHSRRAAAARRVGARRCFVTVDQAWSPRRRALGLLTTEG